MRLIEYVFESWNFDSAWYFSMLLEVLLILNALYTRGCDSSRSGELL